MRSRLERVTHAFGLLDESVSVSGDAKDAFPVLTPSRENDERVGGSVDQRLGPIARRD